MSASVYDQSMPISAHDQSYPNFNQGMSGKYANKSATESANRSSNEFSSSHTGVMDSSAAATKGRWTAEEHQRFIEALRKFGKDWYRVEEYIGTRSSAQIRSHA